MKKIITTIGSILLLTIVSAKAEIGIGISGAMHFISGDGTETTRTSNQKNTGSHDEEAVVPEIFIEAIGDNGIALGVSYIPTRDIGSKSRSDTNSDGDTGSYKAAAELDNVIKFYTDIPAGSIVGYPTYIHLGIQHVTLTTLESLNSGETYPSKDLFGATFGVGTKGDLPFGNNLYYKGELTYTNFETYKGEASSNTVEADLQDFAARFSIGYKF